MGVDGGIAPPALIATRPPGKATGNAQRVRGLSQLRCMGGLSKRLRRAVNYGVPERPRRSRPQLSDGG